MKKPTIIGLFIVIIVVSALLLRYHAMISKFDRDFQKDLAGTWSSRLDNMRLTNVVMADGSFSCHLIFTHPERTNSYDETGTWLVKDGSLIETIKTDTNPTARSPRSHVGQIIHADAHEFMVHWQGSPDKWTWQKAGE